MCLWKEEHSPSNLNNGHSLCEAILDGAFEELRGSVINHAFPAEQEGEEHLEHGLLDGIFSEQDVAEPMMKRRRLDLNELCREED